MRGSNERKMKYEEFLVSKVINQTTISARKIWEGNIIAQDITNKVEEL